VGEVKVFALDSFTQPDKENKENNVVSVVFVVLLCEIR